MGIGHGETAQDRTKDTARQETAGCNKNKKTNSTQARPNNCTRCHFDQKHGVGFDIFSFGILLRSERYTVVCPTQLQAPQVSTNRTQTTANNNSNNDSTRVTSNSTPPPPTTTFSRTYLPRCAVCTGLPGSRRNRSTMQGARGDTATSKRAYNCSRFLVRVSFFFGRERGWGGEAACARVRCLPSRE